MDRQRPTLAEVAEIVRAMPFYDRRTGKRIPSRTEWEQFGRWRRWRDILLGWVPPRERRFPWEED
jgi:hypothetical protein